MRGKTHSEHMKEQMANPDYAAASEEMKAELDREFQHAEEDERQLLAATPTSELPSKARAGRNGASRRSHTEKTKHASNRK